MLTRFVRNQLIIFTIASIVGVAVMLFTYMQVPTLLGLGRITVKVELPATGGLYRFSNVTYRGVQVGKVTGVTLTDKGVEATMSLATSPKIPADLHAEVRSVSAVGEQYVDLRPRTDSPPYLQDGSVIAMRDTSIPQAVGPMLDQVSALVDSIPRDKLSELLDESFLAFDGAGYDFESLLDSAATVTEDLRGASGEARALIDDSGPFLDAQNQTTDAIGTWARSLAGITEQMDRNDPDIRALLQTGPGFAQEVSQLLNQVKPTLPVLLANLTTIGQVGVTYNPSIEQLLVLLPPYIAAQQTYGLATKNPTGLPAGEFSLMLGDPPPCTVGFLPPSQWRNPADTTTVDTPDGLYCKLPQDSPIAVRGARNYPCMGHPGKRAPTVEICNSDKPFEPLALRQHALGPYPFDPNLVAQGIPMDDRVTFEDFIYGPLQGTAMPDPDAPPPAVDPPPEDGVSPFVAPPAPPENPVPPALDPNAPPPSYVPPFPNVLLPPIPPPGAPPPVPPPGPAPPVPPPPWIPPPPAPWAPWTPQSAAPASFDGSGAAGPSVAITQYDPRTGEYVAPDGQVFRQSDLAVSSDAKSWQDLMPT